MDVTLRTVVPEDLATIRHWAERAQLDLFMSRWVPRAFSEGRWPEPLTWWQVIIVDGDEVGSLWLERATADADAMLGLFIAESEWRGRGVGRRVIELALGAAAASRIERIRLHVRETNLPAIRCYQRAGFAMVGRGEKADAGARIRFLEMARPVSD